MGGHLIRTRAGDQQHGFNNTYTKIGNSGKEIFECWGKGNHPNMGQEPQKNELFKNVV